MKQKVVAVAIALASFAAYGADGTPSTNNTQQTVQTQNGQAQTTMPSDKTKPTSNEGAIAQGKDHVDPWTLLNQGWKQFYQTGK
jgi:hypothetical protein